MSSSEKISINLLPQEVVLNQVKQKKFYKIQTISVAVVLFFIFLTSTTFALRILTRQNATLAKEEFESAQNRVSQFSSKETQLTLLKKRLNMIDSLSKPSKQRAMFNLVISLIPESVIISSQQVDQSGNVVLTAIVSSTDDLEAVTDNLLDKEKNEDRISKVDLESLSRGREGVYRVNIKITAK